MGLHWSFWPVFLSLVAPSLSCPGVVGGIALAVVSSQGSGSGSDGGSSDDAACSHTALQHLAPALLGKPVPGALALAVPSSCRGTTGLFPLQHVGAVWAAMTQEQVPVVPWWQQ